MPDPKDNAKRTGDTHPPDVDDGLDTGRPEGLPDSLGADGTPRDRGQARTSDAGTPADPQSRPGGGPGRGEAGR